MIKDKYIGLRRKLIKQLMALLLIMAFIAAAGLVCIAILKKTSNQIVFEFNELNVVQELRFSFNQSFLPASNYFTYNDPDDLEIFQNQISIAKADLLKCRSVLSNRHSLEILDLLEEIIFKYEHTIRFSRQDKNSLEENVKLVTQLSNMLDEANEQIEHLLLETTNETKEHIITNNTAAKHSSTTIVILTVLLIVFSVFLGIIFVGKITSPIEELVSITQKVADGDLSAEILLSTNDELEILAKSFNRMVVKLKSTTVSKNYFDDILKSMYESIIVTDSEGKITLANTASRNLLKYTKSELLGTSVNKVIFSKEFQSPFSDFSRFEEESVMNNTEMIYLSKDGEQIPVLFSSSILKNTNSQILGAVFVAHDIRERKSMYQKLEAIRKKHSIEINEAEENERIRIAREIHDGLGQMLTGIAYAIENSFSEKAADDDQINSNIARLQKMIDDTIKESKNIAHDLIPILLKDFGLVTAIENLVQQMNQQYILKIELNVMNFNNRISEQLEKTFYRIIQESLNNIVKHAEAKNVTIQLVKKKEFVSLLIIDDGKGFDTAENKRFGKNGIGLISMRERVETFDGLFSLNSEINNGTEILVEIPIT